MRVKELNGYYAKPILQKKYEDNAKFTNVISGMPFFNARKNKILKIQGYKAIEIIQCRDSEFHYCRLFKKDLQYNIPFSTQRRKIFYCRCRCNIKFRKW